MRWALLGIAHFGAGSLSVTVPKQYVEFGSRAPARRLFTSDCENANGLSRGECDEQAPHEEKHLEPRSDSTGLFGSKATDPSTLLSAASLLLVAAGVAAYIPARRASHVDPSRAKRV
jgi:ABC-type antimicrobial peptide transport system permease subunit